MVDCIAIVKLLKCRLNIKFGTDNLITCKENEMNVDFLMFCCLSEM